MRQLLVVAMAMLAGCATPPDRSVTSAPVSGPVTPVNITRVRAALPAGYEIGQLARPSSAAALWGFGTGWTAHPPQCAALADPVAGGRTARGVSASGPGGTVFVIAAAGPESPPDPDLLAQCSSWTMNFGHTDAVVTRGEGPAVEAAQTIAWRARARTVVESGNATLADASTAIAYVDGHTALITVVTDPGAPHPALDPGFAAGLLNAAVAALRG